MIRSVARPSRAIGAAACVIAGAISLCACVTVEDEGSLGATGSFRRDTARTVAEVRERRREAGLDEPIDLREAMTPAADARTASGRVTVALAPLGRVPFNGQVLPVVAPDGRTLATQVGEPVAWEALTGEPTDQINTQPGISRVEMLELDSLDAAAPLWASEFGDGTVLLASTPQGALIEQPDPQTAAPTLMLAPWSGDDPRALTPTDRAEVGRGTQLSHLHRWTIGEDHRGVVVTARDTTGSPIAQTPIGLRATPLLLYQLWITSSAGPAAGVYEPPPGLLVLNPRIDRMVMFTPQGDSVLLAEGSFAAAFIHDGGWGVIITTGEGVFFQRLVPTADSWTALPPTRVMDGQYVPRSTTDPARPIILIGPTDNPLELQLVGLSIPDSSSP